MPKLWTKRVKTSKPVRQALEEEYEQRKQTFLFLNISTADEYEKFCKELAAELGI